jgi:hypothetical protein
MERPEDKTGTVDEEEMITFFHAEVLARDRGDGKGRRYQPMSGRPATGLRK